MGDAATGTEMAEVVMSRCFAAALLSLFVFSTSPARAADPASAPVDTGCKGTLVGALKATFSCDVAVVKKADGVVTFTVKPRSPVKGLKAFEPATFSINPPISVHTYSHRDLVAGSSSATTDAGKKFSATEKLGSRGDIEVQVTSAEKNRGSVFGFIKIHAHLVPADVKDTSEIQVTIETLAGW
jgi:hypothetical protein